MNNLSMVYVNKIELIDISWRRPEKSLHSEPHFTL